MEKTITHFDSFAEADAAERRYYASLTPQERLDILLEIVSQYRESLGEAGKGFERVLRVVELSQR